jgi:hypothetical protein
MTAADLLTDEDVTALRREIAELPLFIQGSLKTVARRCGRPGCHCATSATGHPTRYLSFTRDGRTRNVYVPVDERGDLIAHGVANYRRLCALVQAMTDTVTAKLRGHPWPKRKRGEHARVPRLRRSKVAP